MWGVRCGAQRAAMIKGILVINNHGKPRLTKFYEHLVRSRLLLDAQRVTMASCSPPATIAAAAPLLHARAVMRTRGHAYHCCVTPPRALSRLPSEITYILGCAASGAPASNDP